MKARLAFVGFLVLAAARGAQEQQPPNGMIYGIAIGQDAQPAKGIRLTAIPLGVSIGAMLPHTRTDDKGKYRFENIPWWGRYSVYADDEEAGYSSFSTGSAGHTDPPEVEIAPEHPKAELTVYLPPRAGFIQIHLTNRGTGAGIPYMRVAVMLTENPDEPMLEGSSESTEVVLVPPDKDILLHVTSGGFREWQESVGRGKPIRLASGARLTLDVPLDPLPRVVPLKTTTTFSARSPRKHWSVAVKSTAGPAAYILSLEPDFDVGHHVLTLELALRRPGDKVDALNLLASIRNWHGLQPFDFNAMDLAEGPDKSASGKGRTIVVKNLGLVAHVAILKAAISPIAGGGYQLDAIGLKIEVDNLY